MQYQRKVFDRYLTVAEEKQLLGHVGRFADLLARRDHAWMRLARHTGVRVCVLAGLTVWDAHRARKEGYLFIRGEINKGDKSYSVYLNKRARESIRVLLRIRREMGHAEIADAPLIMSRNHRGMSVRSFQHRMKVWVKSAGLNVEASPHWWRHTLGKRLMSQSTARDPRGIAQHALGHSAITSTGIYTAPDKEAIALAMEEAS